MAEWAKNSGRRCFTSSGVPLSMIRPWLHQDHAVRIVQQVQAMDG